jgi:hypothetical protein
MCQEKKDKKRWCEESENNLSNITEKEEELLLDIDKTDKQYLEHIFKSIEDKNKDEKIYFFHAVLRTTINGKSTYEDFVGYNYKDKKDKLIDYVYDVLKYFCECGTIANAHIPNGRETEIWYIKSEDYSIPNCRADKCITTKDVKKINHDITGFDYEEIIGQSSEEIIGQSSKEREKYLIECLKMKKTEEKNSYGSIKAIFVTSGNKKKDYTEEKNKGIDLILKDYQDIIKQDDYYGFGAAIFYITDNTNKISEDFTMDVMDILNQVMIEKIVKLYQEKDSLHKELKHRNETIKSFVDEITNEAEKMKQIATMLEYEANNFGYMFRKLLNKKINEILPIKSGTECHKPEKRCLSRYIKIIKENLGLPPDMYENFQKRLKELENKNDENDENVNFFTALKKIRGNNISVEFPIILIANFFTKLSDFENFHDFHFNTLNEYCIENIDNKKIDNEIAETLINGLDSLFANSDFEGYIDLKLELENDTFKIIIKNNPEANDNNGDIKNLYNKVVEKDGKKFDDSINLNTKIIRNLLGISQKNYEDITIKNSTVIAKIELIDEKIVISYTLS